MSQFPALSILVATILILQLSYSLKTAVPGMRKAHILPGVLQLFAAFVALMRGSTLPEIIPHEILTVLSYFFSLYLTFTAFIAIAAVEVRHRKIVASLWIAAAIGFWALSIG